MTRIPLVSADGRALPPFEAGAHVDVHLAPGLARRYSLCGDPAERGSYRIAVLRDPALIGQALVTYPGKAYPRTRSMNTSPARSRHRPPVAATAPRKEPAR